MAGGEIILVNGGPVDLYRVGAGGYDGSRISAAVATRSSHAIRLLPRGDFKVSGRRFLVNDFTFKSILNDVAGREGGGRDLMVDFDYGTLLSCAELGGRRAPAAGWLTAGSLRLQPGGIYGTVVWTMGNAYRSVNRGELRYIVPVVNVRADGVVVGLRNLTLTNMPGRVRVETVAASAAGLPVHGLTRLVCGR